MRPIIVEGVDNSGKTTLIEKLSKAFNMEVVLSCRSLPLNDQLEWIQQQVEREKPVIHDRFTLISEEVYGPILRGGSKFDDLAKINMTIPELWENIESSMNPIIIYCRPHRSTIIKTFKEREQIAGAEENLGGLIERYDYIMGKIWVYNKLDIFFYDWQYDIYANNLIQAINKIDELRYGYHMDYKIREGMRI